MKNFPINSLSKTLTLVTLLFNFVACSNVELDPSVVKTYSRSSTTIDFCTSESNAVKSHLKFIFVVDRSASNKGVDVAGTDINGERRFDPIINFANDFPVAPGQEDYVSWSMINFASSQGLTQPFTTDRAGFVDFVQAEKDGPDPANPAPNDVGGTNYLRAFAALKSMISIDIKAARSKDPIESTSYVVFFLSDGFPRIAKGGVLVLQTPDEVKAAVKEVVALEDLHRDVVDSLTISSIYYYNDVVDDLAESYVKDVAKEGGGVFFPSSENNSIDFTRFTLPNLNIRFSLQEIWVQNVSTSWLNSNLEGDSDMDGLPDIEEIRLNSDPFNPDSDGNGVSDGIWTRVTGIPCANLDYETKGCPTNGAVVARPNNCSALGSPPYADDDGDYLNNCEEIILLSDSKDADTNKDYIPDSLAFTHNINIINSSFASTADADFDGLSDYREIKYNLPLRVHNGDVAGAFRMQYSGGVTTSDANQDCYHFDMFNIATRSSTDTLRVFLVENSLLAERRLIRSAQLTYDSGTVAFKDDDFVTLKSKL